MSEEADEELQVALAQLFVPLLLVVLFSENNMPCVGFKRPCRGDPMIPQKSSDAFIAQTSR